MSNYCCPTASWMTGRTARADAPASTTKQQHRFRLLRSTSMALTVPNGTRVGEGNSRAQVDALHLSN